MSAPIELRAGLLPDDVRRLRWLREDLTSCLIQIGGILRRTSGEFGDLPASQVTIGAPLARGPDSEDLRDPLAETALQPPLHPPVTITWVWADGSTVHYDWRSQAWQVARARD